MLARSFKRNETASSNLVSAVCGRHGGKNRGDALVSLEFRRSVRRKRETPRRRNRAFLSPVKDVVSAAHGFTYGRLGKRSLGVPEPEIAHLLVQGVRFNLADQSLCRCIAQ
jgi:hypothetical protein